jgi:hypothetical protein
MKNAFLAALVIVPLSAHGQTAPTSEEVSIQDQIKNDRAKSKADFENGPKGRPWDRDANGKRPWERNEPPLPKQ